MQRELPILFSTHMVHALLAGRKTQTRRIVKPHPDENGATYMPVAPALDWEEYYKMEWKPWQWDTENGESIMKHCPYGSKGDLLWVRETFTVFEPEHCEGMRNRHCYKASFHESAEEWRKECISDGYSYNWKPSIFMPKYAARIWLEVLDVRIERLHEISEKDAKAEGVADGNDFKSLWQKINRNWGDNPWVWVVEFKVAAVVGRPVSVNSESWKDSSNAL